MLKEKKKHFIGVWDYTVLLTFLGFFAGITGIVFALVANLRPFNGTNVVIVENWDKIGFYVSLGCLIFAGLCDSFDGVVARSKKNRTESEKRFGVQLDSLSDLVCFGVLPALIGYRIGLKSPWWILLLVFYCLMALVRLAWFNVEEIEKDINKCVSKSQAGENVSGEVAATYDKPTEKRTFYYGLPVTNVSWILPIVCCFKPLLGKNFGYLYAFALAVIGFLFVFKFKMKKLSVKQMIPLIIFTTVCFITILVLGITLDIEW